MASNPHPITYPDGDVTCRGEYFLPDDAGDARLPVILVIHAWDGLIDEVRGKCTRLADAGYIAFALDVHGEGRTYSDFTELDAALGPFMADRAMLLQRLLAALPAAKSIPGADAGRMAVMGYCFGGTCALDLARDAGPDLRAAVSFHGGLLGNGLAQEAPITARVLVLHGHDDPMVPPEQVLEFETEMTARQADWQLIAYGNTVHGFTRPDANKPEIGVVYNAESDRRSWQAMLGFFAETL